MRPNCAGQALDIAANRIARKWTRKEQMGRVLWTAFQPLFRVSPRLCWGWRRFLLRLFGARIGREVQIHPSVRITIPWNLDVGDLSAIEDVKSVLGADKVGRCRIPPPGLRERWTAIDAGRTLGATIPGYDLLHLHGVWDPVLWQSARVSQRLHTPYIIAPHGMLDPWSLRQKAWKKRAALALGWRRVLNRSAFLHVLNSDERQLLARLGLTCPTEVIPNGVFIDELENFSPRDFFEATYGFPGRRVVLFFGRLHHKKGLDFLADAFKILHESLPDVHLVVAGPDGGAGAGFAQQISQAGLPDYVHLIGPLYGNDKYSALRSAGCFCLPSRQEGFSVAILEAMACRLPVVISEACHFREVADCGAGRVVALDPAEIATALHELLDDRDGSQRMGAAGYELVRSRYTWPQIARRCIAAYERAIAKSSC
jgi:glycosyltransferase involved in cell wall biosynthesis